MSLPDSVLTLCLAAASVVATAPAWAWDPAHTLEGPFAVSSPPDAPRVAMNGAGRALLAWNATGVVRVAAKPPGGRWTRSVAVRGGFTGAGPVAVAIGDNGVQAVAFTTAATRYEPSWLRVALAEPGAGFGPAVDVAPGTGVWTLRLGVACDGTVTLLWNDGGGVQVSERAGVPGPGACDGRPGPGSWPAAQTVSDPALGAALPDLSVEPGGTAVAVWQQGASGQPTSIGAAIRPAGGEWGPAVTVSGATTGATWNPTAAMDGLGRAAVGYLDGATMRVVRADASGHWGPPETVSGVLQVGYPALATNAAGDLLAAFQAFDGGPAVWQTHAVGGSAWSAPQRLSSPAEAAGWPAAAWAGDGSVAVVGWTDDTSLTTRVAVDDGSGWARRSLGAGWWGGSVPVAAGGGRTVAGWATSTQGNPNSARLLASTGP
jgi:hypothetical protein